MKNSESTEQVIHEQTNENTDIHKLCEEMFIVPPSALSEEVHMLLKNVLKLQGSVDKSIDWLTKPNNALEGKQPVELIRENKIQRLRDFWAECERRYGY